MTNQLDITPIKALQDNYIWAITDIETQQVVIIDPATAQPVIDFIKKQELTLVAIWITHKHYDHIGGVEKLTNVYPNIDLVAHPQHPVDQTYSVDEGSVFEVFGHSVKVLKTAGHTENHLSYIINERCHDTIHVFCGDTLFSGGCGRVFTGDMQAMYNSLMKLSKPDKSVSDDNIWLYPAHEYTASNLRFGASIEPNNTDIQQYLADVENIVAQGEPSLPTTLALEQKTNVFLRLTEHSVINGLEQHQTLSNYQPITVFTALRTLKDHF